MKPAARAAYRYCALAAVLVLSGAPGHSQNKGDPGEIRGLKLGLKAQSMTADGFGEFACGSNGGPPRQKIEDWSGFAKGAPEADGLREVQVRFEDEQEYIGKAIADDRYADRRGSTRVAG